MDTNRWITRTLLLMGVLASLLCTGASVGEINGVPVENIDKINDIAWGSVMMANGVPTAAPTNLDCYGTTADGSILYSGSSWSTVRAHNGGDTVVTNDTDATLCMAWLLAGSYYDMRGFLYPNTAGLPDTCTPTAAVLHLYVSAVTNAAQITVYAGTQSDTLDAVDYNQNYTQAAWSSATSVTAGQYNNITLNAAGIAAINKTGITKMCIMESGHDVTGTTPPDATQYSVSIRYADYADTTYDPYVSITYTP